MTRDGLEHLAEARFDIEAMSVHCESPRERELLQNIYDEIVAMRNEVGKCYNRRTNEVTEITHQPAVIDE